MTTGPDGTTLSPLDRLARDLRDGLAAHLPYLLFSVMLVCCSVVAGVLSQSVGSSRIGQLPFTRLAASILTQDQPLAALIRTDTEFVSVLVVGAVTLGAVTALGLVAQGAVVGLYLGSSAGAVSPGFLFVAIAPHGIVKVFGLALAAAASFRLVVRALAALIGQQRYLDNREWRQTGLVVVAAWVIVVVAAVIEVVVTGRLTQLFV
jgi:uncharacterized membrane protein SpoIIM required for sporulation